MHISPKTLMVSRFCEHPIINSIPGCVTIEIKIIPPLPASSRQSKTITAPCSMQPNTQQALNYQKVHLPKSWDLQKVSMCGAPLTLAFIVPHKITLHLSSSKQCYQHNTSILKDIVCTRWLTPEGSRVAPWGARNFYVSLIRSVSQKYQNTSLETFILSENSLQINIIIKDNNI